MNEIKKKPGQNNTRRKLNAHYDANDMHFIIYSSTINNRQQNIKNTE